MNILGIETSCDETAAAIVTDQREIKSNILRSQIQEHAPYGGVVPEIAARSHMDDLEDIIKASLKEAHLSLSDLDGIAVTAGPGLIGGILVGVMMAKALAAVHEIPFLAVNHLAGHALTTRLTHGIDYPFLLLLVSGGHTQLLIVRSVTSFQLLGTTIDDAVGEAFDKSARLLGHPYPGGPAIEKHAQVGNSQRFSFPRPLMAHRVREYSPFSFSFSGLKTAVRSEIQKYFLNKKDNQFKKEAITQDLKTIRADICASFQAAVGDVLVNRSQNAFNYCQKHNIPITHFVVSGGVAANQYIKYRLTELSDKNSIPFVAPPVTLCTDNGAMIAWCGIEKLQAGLTDSLEFSPRARWPLEEIEKNFNGR